MQIGYFSFCVMMSRVEPLSYDGSHGPGVGPISSALRIRAYRSVIAYILLHRFVDGGVDAIRILVPQVQPLGNFPIPQPPIPRRILPQALILGPQALDLPNSALVMPRPPRPAVVGVGAGAGFVAVSHCAPLSCSAEWAARQSIPRLASTRRAACVCALSSLPLATSSSFSMRDGGRIFLSVIRRWYSSHSSARRWDSSALRSARVFICRRQLLWGMWPAGLTAPSSQ